MKKPMDPNRIPLVMYSMSFKVTGDSEFNPYSYDITPAIRDALRKSLQSANYFSKGKNSAGIIRRFIQRYPHVPTFKNHLFVHCYKNLSFGEAMEVAIECDKRHPDYFFSGIMLAQLWIRVDLLRPHIPKVLNDWNIVEYGGRDTFDDAEFRAYFLLAAEYYLKNGQREMASRFVAFVEDMSINPKHEGILEMRKKVDSPDASV